MNNPTMSPAMLSKTERGALEVIVSQHAETRRGARGDVIRMALSASKPERRRQLDAALQSLVKQRLVISGPLGWVPTDEARAALAGADDCDEPPATVRDPLSVEGGGAGEALPAVEYPAAQERIGQPVPAVPGELLERCAALISMQLAKSTRMWEGGDAAAVADIAWLRETAQMIVDAGERDRG